MGRLVRRFIRANKLVQGTDALPITDNVASLIAHEIGRSVAIAGTAEGLKSTVECYITSGVLNMVAVHAKVSVTSAKTQGGGYQYGIHVENEVLGTATHAGLLEGMRIEQYVEDTTTFASATVFGIHIANSISKQPGSYSFIRMSEDGACYVDNVFVITKGASCTNIKYLFYISYGAAIDMVITTGTCTSAAGYLKIKCNTEDRYIQLYSTPP
jgi:hypothetical protein